MFRLISRSACALMLMAFSATAITMQALEKVAGIKYRTIFYDGGKPAAVSTAIGDTHFTAATATGQFDLIHDGRLFPLAVMADEPLELEGYGTVPPVTDWLPDANTAPNYFGLFLPADAPPDVLEAMDRVWQEKIMTSEKMRTFASQRGAIFRPVFGDAAVEVAMPYLSLNAWQQYENGDAPNNPELFDIPKPE